MALSDAERARRYRNRHRGQPRQLSDNPVARAKRALRRGLKMADLDPIDADALRAYNAERARERRSR